MYFGKWWTLSAAAALEFVAGLNATYGLYALAVRDTFDYTQSQVQGIGTALITAGFLAIVPGVIFDRLHHHHKLGPRLVALVGGLLTSLGYILSWASFQQHISSNYWLIIFWQLLLCHGMAWLDTATICTAIINLPGHEGAVSGLLKSFHGLGGSLPAAIFATYSALQGIDFTAFLAIVALVVTLIAAPVLNIVPWLEESESTDQPHTLRPYGRILTICGFVLLLVIYQLVSGLTTDDVRPDTTEKIGLLAGTLTLTFLVLLYIAVGLPLRRPILFSQPMKRLPQISPQSSHANSQPLLEATSGGSPASPEPTPEDTPPPDVPNVGGLSKDDHDTDLRDFTVWDSVQSLDFWILWISMFIGTAAGFVLLSNVGEQISALGGRKGSQSVYVLALTATNVSGRILLGIGSDWVLVKFGVSRTLLLVLLALGNAVTFLMAAFVGLRVLLVCMVMAGFVLGGHWALMAALIADLLGHKKAFASNFALIHLSNSAGMLVLNTGVVGPLYESVAKSHGEPAGYCTGQDCFRVGYIVIAALSVVQALLSLWLCLRNKAVYRALSLRMKARESAL